MISEFVPTFAEQRVITEIVNVNVGNSRVRKDLKHGFSFFPLNFVVGCK